MSLAKVVLNDIGTLANGASARQALNDNFQKIEDEFKKVVYRDGSTPNSMEADLDMDSHRILNVADAVHDKDAVNKGQVADIARDAVEETLQPMIDDLVGHVEDELSRIQTELDSKADASHTHEIADVDGLQAALDGKLGTTATAAAATKLAAPRTIKIGKTGKTFDGTADVTWTLAEIGVGSGGDEIPDLDDLMNVFITDNTAGEVLQWDGTAWINRTLAELGVAEAAHTHSASDITSGTLSDARLPSTMSGKTFTGGISAPSVAIGDQLGYIYQSNSAGAVSVRVGTVGNEKFFAFSEDGRFYAHSGGGSFGGDVVVAGRVTASEFANPGGTPGPKYFVGDDAALHDVNLPHTIGVAGLASPEYGYIKFGAAPGVIGWNGTTHIVESSLHVFGDVTANGYAVASSRELKQDIRPLDVGADIIDRFQPVVFRYRAEPDREVAGLILEDVAEIFPLACTEDGIDYGQLVPMLIATIQHDRARLRDLAARVEALEQTLTSE